MTATILVVDDLIPNIKLLEAKLLQEYYDVITAKSGAEALLILKSHQIDLVLLDVMMPEMDGFEVCKIIKSDQKLSDIPVVMVTALSEVEDRIEGIKSGADDFLTKPINDMALFARIRSLVRTKRMIDEIKLRDQSRNLLGIDVQTKEQQHSLKEAKILVIDDDEIENRNLKAKLQNHVQSIESISDPSNILEHVSEMHYDLFIVSLQMSDYDGLRICSQLKTQKSLRHIPCLLTVEEGDTESIVKGLDIGASDYIVTPIDINEMLARATSQFKRKKYQEELLQSYEDSLNMSLTDSLTSLYNRRYFDVHLEKLSDQAKETKKHLCMMIIDLDFFKKINDNYGHAAGDAVIKQSSKIFLDSVRITDLVARYGGEEFIILLPDTEIDDAKNISERLRSQMEEHDFIISDDGQSINTTCSIGIATLNISETSMDFMKRADSKLYEAKNSGRNKVVSDE